MRVVPIHDGLCPACRRFNFHSMPADDAAVQNARAAAERALQDIHHDAAILYWKLFGSVFALLVSVVVAFLIGWFDDAWFASEDSQERALAVLSVVLVAATAYSQHAARRLSTLLRLYREGEQGPRLFFVVLRDSFDYFKERTVPMTFLGPDVAPQPENE
jgi:uncharacterized membrane protein YcjF (UPF0283 family)